MVLPKPRAIPPTIPAAALADLVLLSVFFFAITTGFETDGRRVSLPASPAASVAEVGSARAIVERTMEPGGREVLRWRFSDGGETPREVLGPQDFYLPASHVAERDPERTFVVQADAGVRWADVDRVVEMLRLAGARNVVYRTRERAP